MTLRLHRYAIPFLLATLIATLVPVRAQGKLRWADDVEGHPKLIVERAYDALGVRPTAVRDYLMFSREYEYNRQGQLLKRTTFSDDGQLEGAITYTYDTADNLIRTVERWGDGSLRFTTDFEYDTRGRLTREITRHDTGAIFWMYEYEHLAHERKIQSTSYSGDGGLEGRFITQLDEDGYTVAETALDPSGTVQAISTHSFHQRNGIAERIRDRRPTGGTPQQSIFEYSDFDAEGNWTTHVWYIRWDGENDEASRITTRTITYY